MYTVIRRIILRIRQNYLNYEADKKEDMPIPKGYTCLREDDYKRAKIMWFQLDQSQ